MYNVKCLLLLINHIKSSAGDDINTHTYTHED